MNRRVTIPVYTAETITEQMNIINSTTNITYDVNKLFTISDEFQISDDLSSGMHIEYRQESLSNGDTVLFLLDNIVYVRAFYKLNQHFRFEPLDKTKNYKVLVFEDHVKYIKLFGKVVRLIKSF